MSVNWEHLRNLVMFIPKDYLGWTKDDVDVPGVTFTSAGGACPVQAEGTYKEFNFYFRFRWGTASLSISKDDAIMNSEHKATAIISDDMDGFMTKNEFLECFTGLLNEIDTEIENGNR